jgi:hypothetical protein
MNQVSYLGYPEPDGGCPFVCIIPIQQKLLLIAGILNGPNRFRDIESSVLEDVTLSELKSHVLSNGVIEVPFLDFLWLVQQLFQGEVAFEELDLIYSCGRIPSEPNFRTELYDIKIASCTHLLMNPETGVFFPLEQAILKEGIKGLVVALQNTEAVRRSIIDAAVDTCSDVCLTDEVRSRWIIVLDALSIIYNTQGKEKACSVAQNNRMAIRLGLSGKSVPFIRAWVNQQLANSLALAQIMTRDDASS